MTAETSKRETPDGTPVAPSRDAVSRVRSLFHRSRGAAADTVWAMGSDVVALFCTLATFTLLTSRLGPEQYGTYAGMYGVISLFGVLTYSWVFLVMFQRIVRERDHLQMLLGSAISIIAIGMSLATVAAIVLGPTLLNGLAVATLLSFALAEWMATAATGVTATIVQAVQGVPYSARIRVAQPVVRLAAVASVLLVADEVTLEQIGVHLLLAYTVFALVMANVLRRRFGLRLRPGRVERQHLSQGGLYGATLGCFSVQEDGDKTLLVTFGYPGDAGVYAAGYRIVQMGIIPVNSMLGASHGRFLASEPGSRNEHVRRASRFTAVAVAYSAVVVLVVETLAPFIADLLGGGFDETADVMRLLAPLVLLRSASHFAYNGLLGLGRYRERVVVIATSAATAIVLYVLLIPRFQWRGAAIATLVAEAVFGVVTWLALIYFQRKHDQAVVDAAVLAENTTVGG